MKQINYILFTTIFTISIFKGFATFQIPDLLIYNNDTLSFFATPLEMLYENTTERTVFFEKDTPSNCWRGYQAVWTINNNHLFLSAINSYNYEEDSLKVNLEKIFPEKYSNGKVKADWVTSNSLSLMNELFTTYKNYPTLVDKDLGFEFEKGNIISIFKCSDINKRIISEIYSNLNWKIYQNENDSIKIIVHITSNINGIIDSIRVLKGYNETYDKEAIRVIEALPERKIYYRNYVLPIIFSYENKKKYRK